MTEKGVKFIPSPRSLFLTSISDEEIKNVASSALKIPNNLRAVKKNGTADSRFSKAMKILDKGIQVESSVEKDFFSKLLNDSRLPPEVSGALLEKIGGLGENSGDGSFNYIQFISIINSILSGAEQYKAILELEGDRMVALNDAYNKIAKIIANEENITNKYNKNIQDNNIDNQVLEEARQKIKDIYLNAHSIGKNSPYMSAFKGVLPTMDNLLAEAIRAAGRTVMNTRSKELIENLQANGGFDSLIPTLRDILIQSAADVARNEITPGFVDKINLGEKIANHIISQIDSKANLDKISAPELSKTFGTTSKARNIIKRTEKESEDVQQKYDVQGEKLSDSLLQILPFLNKDEESKNRNALLLSILNDDKNSIAFKGEKQKAIKMLESLQNDIIALENAQKEMENIKPENSNADLSYLDEMIKGLKEDIKNKKKALSSQLASKIQDLIDNQTDSIRDEYVHKLEECFEQGTINISGPQLAEIVEKAVISLVAANDTSSVSSFQTGQFNSKADTIIIKVSPAKPTGEISMKKLDDKIYQTTADIIPEFFNTFQINLKRGKNESFSLKKGKQAWSTAVTDAAQKIEASIKKSQNIEELSPEILKKIANQLKESIVVTNTMKTFNQYNNDIGFLSGSLGANISAQIANFSTLFESAGAGGFSPDEVSALEVLLVNCSSAAMGAKNKKPLEKMLSVLAGFAVFDEGSAELEMIAETNKDYYTEYSPRIMHLYKLNALYFPGSYILQRIKDHLTQVTQAASANSNKIINNDGAVIRAVADESLVPKEGTPEEKWTQAFSKALSNEYTSVSVAFVSGLLDIVNQLSEAMRP